MKNSTPQHPLQYYRAKQLNELDKLPIDIKNIKQYAKKKISYYNYPVSFDIETSSFRVDGEPRATMYIWQMGFGDEGKDLLVVGRTWEEWLQFLRVVRKHFHLKIDRVLVCYCHNLSYEAQFIRKFFEWQKVFALDKREPIYMRTKWGLEFRCSLKLSGYKLETLAKNLLYHDIQKMVGDLDYSKIRHSKTPLTEKEIGYCLNDVKVVCAYISERLEIDGNITKIPLTKTGYVRNACKIACYGTDHKASQFYKYRELMQSLTVTPHEYNLLRCAFMGGFTHANSFYVGDILKNVTSCDFCSSYPYVMFSELYPMSKGELCYPDVEEVYKKLHTYAWILDIELYGVESKILQEDFLSFSRCVDCKNYVLNNGRINKADYIHIVVTSIDFDIILKTYRVSGGVRILQAYKYFLGYLPTVFMNELLSYYTGKTTLKGVQGKEQEYLRSKGQLNSCYGMIVTSPIRPNIIYKNDEWFSERVKIEKGVSKYNNNPNRFTFYPWGVWVTAYARRNLWDGILNLGADYVYSDTDSVKFLNYKDHTEYFSTYNEKVVEKLRMACDFHKIPFETVTPKTIKGVQKTLGIWEYESTTPNTPTYSRFKTLGAKRYMIEDYTTHDISLTVSGLNKKSAIPYLLDKFGKDKIFDAFKDDELGVDNMIIPQGFSGRMVSTYIDDEIEGEVIDYLGNVGYYREQSCINLENSTYTLSLSKDYIKFLMGIRTQLDYNDLY